MIGRAGNKGLRLYLVLGREVRVGLDHPVMGRGRARATARAMGMDRARARACAMDRVRARVRGMDRVRARVRGMDRVRGI